MPDLTLTSATPAPAAISGKALTLVMLVILLVTGALFYWFTMAYADYNAARRKTDRAWRELVPGLDVRYRAYDLNIAQRIDNREIEAQTAQEWLAARDRFSGTVLTAHQIPAAQSLEDLIAALPPSPVANQPDPLPLLKLSNEYTQAAVNQQVVGQSLGSKLLKLFLNLPEPHEFDIAN
jgi:hypothetical protein